MGILKQTLSLAIKVWYTTFLIFTAGFIIAVNYKSFVDNDFDDMIVLMTIGCLVASSIGSLPALVAMQLILPLIKRFIKYPLYSIYAFLFLTFLISVPYGLAYGLFTKWPLNEYNTIIDLLKEVGIGSGLLFAASSIAILIQLKHVKEFFNYQKSKNTIMESHEQIHENVQNENASTIKQKKNNILLKALLVGGLILIMLIPMAFIQSLVMERKERQADAIKEVSSKWAGPQTISNPYLVIPYTDSTQVGNTGKIISVTKYLTLLPENNSVKGNMIPEIRKRSIYKVPLYRSDINMNGDFDLNRISKYIQPDRIIFSGIKICFGLTEFKGVEEAIHIKAGDSDLLMVPGLPVNNIDELGLNSPLAITNESLSKKLSYSLNIKIKGSEQIQFEPLSGNSDFYLKSSWPSPSFMGNQIPSPKPNVTDSGFTASWKFNQANLPFDLVLKDKDISDNELAFGVSMVQTIDTYTQTLRCVKYAILIIGLSFAIFFIIELMQKNPVHPIQYALVGLALSIYYTLLLSISEVTAFSIAYAIAAIATILLIAFYAQTHFKNIKTASVFGGFLTLLYGFIYVLIQLEDTALLVGSIALFIILAVVMYITRKVNWYKL